MFVCAALAKENLVCAAAMVCAIVTLIVSIFVCVLACLCVAGGPFRRLGHFRAAVGPPQAYGVGAPTSHAVCVPECMRVCPCVRRGEINKYSAFIREGGRGGFEKYEYITFVILHYMCVCVCVEGGVTQRSCVRLCSICADVMNEVSTQIGDNSAAVCLFVNVYVSL